MNISVSLYGERTTLRIPESVMLLINISLIVVFALEPTNLRAARYSLARSDERATRVISDIYLRKKHLELSIRPKSRSARGDVLAMYVVKGLGSMNRRSGARAKAKTIREN